MSSLLFIGECMLELRKSGAHHYARDFAGDTYNSAIYAKWWAPELDVAYFTALGRDAISEEMLEAWQAHGLNCRHVLRSKTKSPGIYSINVDVNGERSFTYWRNDSAARKMMRLLADQDQSNAVFDYAYVSGISFAILDDDDKQALANYLKTLKSRGCKIAYDPNYRPKMWRDLEHAVYWNDVAYQLADIVFPGDEDHRALYQHQNQLEVIDYLATIGEQKEIVLKWGIDGVYVYQGKQQKAHKPFAPAPTQIDSTAAGDSFAGTYLAARAQQHAPDFAIEAAMAIAALVVQHPGAIVDKAAYQAVREQITLA